MSSVFVSRSAPEQTKASKRISRLAIKVNKAVAKSRRSGPVTVTPGNGQVVARETETVKQYRDFLMGY